MRDLTHAPWHPAAPPSPVQPAPALWRQDTRSARAGLVLGGFLPAHLPLCSFQGLHLIALASANLLMGSIFRGWPPGFDNNRKVSPTPGGRQMGRSREQLWVWGKQLWVWGKQPWVGEKSPGVGENNSGVGDWAW